MVAADQVGRFCNSSVLETLDPHSALFVARPDDVALVLPADDDDALTTWARAL
jgi:hypothetical protein